MAVVIDANLVVVFLNRRDPRRAAVRDLFASWNEAGETLHAPSLIQYEIASALTGQIAAEQLSAEAARGVWSAMDTLPITLHPLTDGPAVIEIARKLRRRSAYDASYVALAIDLGTEVWTLDGPLARNAADAGLPVRLVGTEAAPS